MSYQLPTAPFGWDELLTDKLNSSADRHFLELGLPGTGKSSLLEGLFVGAAGARAKGVSSRGIGLIDVHGDAYRNLRQRLASMRVRTPELDDLVVLIDPTDPDWTVKYNPLEVSPGEFPELKAQTLADAIVSIYQDDPVGTNRMWGVLYHSFLALMLDGRTLLDFKDFLQLKEEREAILGRVKRRDLTNYWHHEFPDRDVREATKWMQGSLNRIGRLTTNPFARQMLDSPVSTINFRDLLDSGKIVLINAPMSSLKLGTNGAYLLCAFLLTEFQNAALSRDELPGSAFRRPFTLLCDEVMNYVNETTLFIIANARKYRLSLGLATQGTQGQDEQHQKLLEGILGTVGTILSYRLNRADAELLAKMLFSPDMKQVKQVRTRRQRAPRFEFEVGGWTWQFGDWSEQVFEPEFYPLAETKEMACQRLMSTPDRCLWVKRSQDRNAQFALAPFVDDVANLPFASQMKDLLQKQSEAAWLICGQSPKASETTIVVEIAPPQLAAESLPYIPLWAA